MLDVDCDVALVSEYAGMSVIFSSISEFACNLEICQGQFLSIILGPITLTLWAHTIVYASF